MYGIPQIAAVTAIKNLLTKENPALDSLQINDMVSSIISQLQAQMTAGDSTVSILIIFQRKNIIYCNNLSVKTKAKRLAFYKLPYDNGSGGLFFILRYCAIN